MLDIKYVIDNLEEVIEKLNNRNTSFEYLRELLLLNDKRKNIIQIVEKKKAERNNVSKEIGRYKREGLDVKELLSSVDDLGISIKNHDEELRLVEEKINATLMNTPNIPHQSVPIGRDENSNLEIRKVGEPRKFEFEIKDHVQLGENLDILDFERAAKITGARFVVYKGLGARLERALIQFMMDLHTFEHGYKEIIPPYIVNNDSMYGTGQFPKFKGEAFKLENFDWYLNPTAEVPTINMHRDEILDANVLPLKYVAYSTAFRSEAGSAGKDTKGILRQHQFNKVELIMISKPEEGYKNLEELLINSEEVLKRLKLPYRVVSLCTGDLGFAAAKTYDIEVWLPGQNKYREIGSISNDEEFQARRSQIRLKRSKDEKSEYVHTINGSGLAVGRTVIAILENYQNEDGSITIPEVLVPYMRVSKISK